MMSDNTCARAAVHGIYAWLQPAAPAAIAVFRLTIDSDNVPCLARPAPVVSAGNFTLLQDHTGTAVDEVVVLRIDAHHVDVHCHGGVGIRAAVDRALLGHGYVVRDSLTARDNDGNNDWQDFSQIAHPAALPLLAQWAQLTQAQRALCMRQPIVLLTGPANAGKSTLLNAWCGHQRALVSEVAGTTRDLLAALAYVDGWMFRVVDSAGLRESTDAIEIAGQALVERARGWADVVLYLQPHDSDARTQVATDIVIHSQADRGANADHEADADSQASDAPLYWSAEPWNSAAGAQAQLEKIQTVLLKRMGLDVIGDRNRN